MSEHIANKHNEKYSNIEAIRFVKEKLQNIDSKTNESFAHRPESLEKIRQDIDLQAISSETVSAEIQPEQSHQSVHYVTNKIKSQRYRATILQIHRHLSPAQRRFSSLIHKPLVESISEVSAKTIARPSGILSGSLITLIGSLFVFYIARKIGFIVPDSIFAILFVIGFLLGLIIEFGASRFTKKSVK